MPAIRPANEDDLAAIARLHVEGWRGAYGGIVDQAYLDSLDIVAREKQWREWFNPAQSPVYIACSDAGQPAGFINFGRLRTPPPGMSAIRPLYAAEIYALYLLPEFYRQGIGTALMQVAAQRLQEEKKNSLCLWVLEKNTRACAFYSKTGGARCGKKEIAIGPTAAREICFGWRDTTPLLRDQATVLTGN